MNVRIYLRVSTESQDLERQKSLISELEQKGAYVAGVYADKCSGNRLERPELNRMLNDLQKNDVVYCENIDRLSRLPLSEAKKLIAAIRDKGAKIAISGVCDFDKIIASSTDEVTRIVLEACQEMLLNLALQIAHNDYLLRRKRQKEGIALNRYKFKGKRRNQELWDKVIECTNLGMTIKRTSELLGVGTATVSRVRRELKQSNKILE